jgi:hypothetical protein
MLVAEAVRRRHLTAPIPPLFLLLLFLPITYLFLMARIQKPPKGRLIVSIIYNSMDGLADALKALEKQFGRVQCETMEIEYTGGKYLEEMGDQLQRRFYSFEKEIERDKLPEVKNACHKIEKQFGDMVHDYAFRTVNIDPGVMTTENVVMASHREYNHRVYLGKGVFAELELVYSRGRFVRLPWTELDFCQGEAIEFFLRVRESFETVDEPAKVS